MMYQNVFSNGGWYETIVRPYDLLHRRRHDLGTDPPQILCDGGHCHFASDPGL